MLSGVPLVIRYDHVSSCWFSMYVYGKTFFFSVDGYIQEIDSMVSFFLW
jgi:hypothetical protein